MCFELLAIRRAPQLTTVLCGRASLIAAIDHKAELFCAYPPPQTDQETCIAGRLLSKKITRIAHAGINFKVVELKPVTVQEQSRRGRRVIFGDIGHLEVLESAGIDSAHALVLTIPDEEAVLRTCAVARRRAPDVFLAARTRVVSKRAGLIEVGSNSVTVDETSAAAEMLRAVMACIDATSREELPHRDPTLREQVSRHRP